MGIVAWDNLAISCRDNLSKGSSVFVTGELQSRKLFTDGGAGRNVVEIKAKKIQFLDAHRVPIDDLGANAQNVTGGDSELASQNH